MSWIKKLLTSWGVVQLAERLTVNQEVAGSSPAAPAILTKGEEMSTKETKQLKQELGKLRARVSELVDQIAVMRNELNRFKQDVATDVKYLTDRVDG